MTETQGIYQCEVLQPQTAEEACRNLKACGNRCALHAGGTDLLVRMRAGFIHPETIIDLSKIESLKTIDTEPDGGVEIGAGVTMSRILEMDGINDKYQSLAESIQTVGSLQIRNRATLAGNICNASPAADTLPSLLLYGARVKIRGTGGQRIEDVEHFVTGPGKINLNPDEFVESVILPRPENIHGSAYLKLGRRKAVDCSIIGVAVKLNDDGNVGIAMGAVSAKPLRVVKAEALLSGKPWNADILNEAVEIVRSEISPIDDIRAAKAYRESMAGVMFGRAFDIAKKRLLDKQNKAEERR